MWAPLKWIAVFCSPAQMFGHRVVLDGPTTSSCTGPQRQQHDFRDVGGTIRTVPKQVFYFHVPDSTQNLDTPSCTGRMTNSYPLQGLVGNTFHDWELSRARRSSRLLVVRVPVRNNLLESVTRSRCVRRLRRSGCTPADFRSTGTIRHHDALVFERGYPWSHTCWSLDLSLGGCFS